MTTWISVKDKLPEESASNSPYIVAIFSSYKNNVVVEPLHFIDGNWYTMSDKELLDMKYQVTHWMPLPEPPHDYKKTKLIAFDYEKYKAGAKAVFRNSPTEIIGIIPNKQNILYPYIYVARYKESGDYEADSMTKHGLHLDENESFKDVLLREEELERRTFWINVYGLSENFCHTIHHSELNADINDIGRTGKLKVIYTEEDLIK